MTRGPAIELSGVTKRYGGVTAVAGASFRVERGEMFFLLGPSGCGKTTLLRIIAGLETPDSGEVVLLGRDAAKLPPSGRGAPMVFQNYALWPHLNVGDNVAFGLVERRVPKAEMRARVKEALALVGLQGLELRMPAELSGGQQQRVALARVLVLNPEIVLLDEPLSNLDARLRREMRDEITRIRTGRDFCIVYVTHDQAEALSLADRMAVMDGGRVSAIGRPTDLYHRPPNEFCARFLGDANLFEVEFAGMEGDIALADTPFGKWRAVPPSGATPLKGEKLLCLVRPENLFIGGAEGSNSICAELREARMQGGTLALRLLSGGVDILATVLNSRGLHLEPGGNAAWHAKADDTVLIRKTPSS